MLSLRSRLASQVPRQWRAYTQACGVPTFGADAGLSPVRYHVFQTPLAYPLGLELQSAVVQERLRRKRDGTGGKTDVLFLLEHTPTYTTGRRDNTPNPEELHPEEKKVVNVGASFHITKRGGQVTYHGPGQIVGYPILDLNEMNTPTRCYVEYLQALLAEYVRSLGLSVDAPHADGHVGVFNGRNEKLASIGIHLSHRITSHGFAMNVTPEPVSWFDLVVACGLDDVRAVSLHELLARLPAQAEQAEQAAGVPLPSVRDVADALVPRFQDTFQRRFVPLGADADAARDGEDADLAFLRDLVARTEDQARREVERAGGWPTRPDTTRQ